MLLTSNISNSMLRRPFSTALQAHPSLWQAKEIILSRKKTMLAICMRAQSRYFVTIFGILKTNMADTWTIVKQGVVVIELIDVTLQIDNEGRRAKVV
jgi:hypothetical protein